MCACFGIYFKLQYKKNSGIHNSFIAPFFRARSDDQAIYRARTHVRFYGYFPSFANFKNAILDKFIVDSFCQIKFKWNRLISIVVHNLANNILMFLRVSVFPRKVLICFTCITLCNCNINTECQNAKIRDLRFIYYVI